MAVTGHLLDRVVAAIPQEQEQPHCQQQHHHPGQPQYHCSHARSVGRSGAALDATSELMGGTLAPRPEHCPHNREHSGRSGDGGGLSSGRRVVKLEIRTITPANTRNGSNTTSSSSSSNSMRCTNNVIIRNNGTGCSNSLIASSSQHVQLLAAAASTRRRVRRATCQLRDYLRSAGVRIGGGGGSCSARRRLYTIWEEEEQQQQDSLRRKQSFQRPSAKTPWRKAADPAGRDKPPVGAAGRVLRDQARSGHRCSA